MIHKTSDRVFDTVVIGGGISGLTAAFRLTRLGRSVRLIERDSRIGGVIQSEKVGTYRCEIGANTVLTKPALRCLITELQLQPITPRAESKNRYISKFRSDSDGGVKEELHALTPSLGALIRTPLVSSKAKLRALSEPFRHHARCDDETVDSFFRRRLGGEITDAIVRPAFTGIFASDIRKLSLRSALPVLYRAEQAGHSLFLSPFRKKSSEAKSSPIKTIGFAQGMAELTTALEFALPPGTVGKQHAVLSLEKAGETAQWEVQTNRETLFARSVILAVPSDEASNILRGVSPETSEMLANIQYAPLGILHLSAPAEGTTTRGFGVLRSLEQEAQRKHDPLIGVIFSSDLFDNRAPAGRSLYTCMVGGAVFPNNFNVNDPEIVRQTVSRVKQLLEFKDDPQVVSAIAWERAIPQFGVGHYRIGDQLARLESQYRSLKVTGNWIEGVSVADCVDRAEKSAAEIHRQLQFEVRQERTRVA